MRIVLLIAAVLLWLCAALEADNMLRGWRLAGPTPAGLGARIGAELALNRALVYAALGLLCLAAAEILRRLRRLDARPHG